MAMMNIVVILPSVLVVTVPILTHGFPAFSMPARMISGRRCYCSVPSISSYKSLLVLGVPGDIRWTSHGYPSCHAGVFSIAALYSPRRAARLHLAR
jgi:hypothetical protein